MSEQVAVGLPKGLATIALLKANFDAKRDHVEMFTPFVVDVIAPRGDAFQLADIKEDLLSVHGLDIPDDPLRIVLTRLVRRGYLRREGGRYVIDHEKLPETNLAEARRRAEEKQQALGESLRQFAQTRGQVLQTADDALSLLLAFFAQHHVRLLVGGFRQPPPHLEQHPTSGGSKTVAAFITETCTGDSGLRATLEDMLAGFVLQNTLFLRDISTASRKFKDLTVFFDTRFLLHVLGLGSKSNVRAAREALTLLRSTGAKQAVFDVTVAEIRGLLKVYISHLGTHGGRLSLHQNELTRFFLNENYMPSDVQQVAALLEDQLKRQQRFAICATPPRDRLYTLDEKALAERLRSEDDTSIHPPRVTHDVDCVAAVLTMRAGRRSGTWDDAKAVFATTTGLVAFNISKWYEDSGEGGVPPIVLMQELSSIAWLKDPSLSPKLKLHELVALCSVALRPSERIWKSFLAHLGREEEKGTLTSDEAVAVLASGLTDRLLGEQGFPDDPDASTMQEVIERVKATYAGEASTKIAEAERSVENAAERQRVAELRTGALVRRVARLTSQIVFWVLCFAVIAAAIGVPQAFESRFILRAAGWILSGAVGVFAIAERVFGTTVVDLTGKIETWCVKRLETWTHIDA